MVVDLGWLGEGGVLNGRGIGVRGRNRVVRMIRENKVRSDVIRDNNCYSNYIEFGV